MIHELKTWPDPFEAVWTDRKRFEVRAYDRPFRVGDQLRLREYDPATKTYTGRVVDRWVSYFLCGPAFGVPSGLCVMSLALEEEQKPVSP